MSVKRGWDQPEVFSVSLDFWALRLTTSSIKTDIQTGVFACFGFEFGFVSIHGIRTHFFTYVSYDIFWWIERVPTGALRHSSDARVITEATRPFRITHVNEAWTKLCGYTPEESYEKTLGILQGPKTDPETVEKLCQDCEQGRATSMKVVNYNKQGGEFNNFLQVRLFFASWLSWNHPESRVQSRSFPSRTAPRREMYRIFSVFWHPLLEFGCDIAYLSVMSPKIIGASTWELPEEILKMKDLLYV